MDPHALVAPLNPYGSPAPLWFLQFFKVVGFVLHLIPMHLWYAGAPLAAILLFKGDDHGKCLAGRIAKLLPFAVALGINFGIVPLLFTQVSYYRVFYPAGILMAWPWFMVIPLLTIGYYAIYFAAWQHKQGGIGQPGRIALAVAASLLVVIGFLFANNFSLMTNVAGWSSMALHHNVAGAVNGIGLNTGDLSMWPRWVMMFGLALLTTAVWILADTAWLAQGESDEYRGWARQFAAQLYRYGVITFVAAGAVYLLTLDGPVRGGLFHGGRFVLTVVTMALPLGVLALVQQAKSERSVLWLTLGGQALVLATNAISRQWVQNHELSAVLSLDADRVVTQWSTLPLFLVCFVAAVALVIWMLLRVCGELAAGGEAAAA